MATLESLRALKRSLIESITVRLLVLMLTAGELGKSVERRPVGASL